MGVVLHAAAIELKLDPPKLPMVRHPSSARFGEGRPKRSALGFRGYPGLFFEDEDGRIRETRIPIDGHELIWRNDPENDGCGCLAGRGHRNRRPAI